MKKWEYRYLHHNESMHTLGKEGWELVCVDASGNFWFKREVE